MKTMLSLPHLLAAAGLLLSFACVEEPIDLDDDAADSTSDADAPLEPELGELPGGEAPGSLDAQGLDGESTPVSTCTAVCGFPFANVSVSGPFCEAQDRDCSVGERGHASNASGTEYCPMCACVDGDTRMWPSDECCCDEGMTTPNRRLDHQVCVNGRWTYAGMYECSGSSCIGEPACHL